MIVVSVVIPILFIAACIAFFVWLWRKKKASTALNELGPGQPTRELDGTHPSKELQGTFFAKELVGDATHAPTELDANHNPANSRAVELEAT